MMTSIDEIYSFHFFLKSPKETPQRIIHQSPSFISTQITKCLDITKLIELNNLYVTYIGEPLFMFGKLEE